MLNFLLLSDNVQIARKNSNILASKNVNYKVSASGSIGQFVNGKCQITHPEHAFDQEERRTDWCSNINKTATDKPWISVSLDKKSAKLNGYSLRSGCCYYSCCCEVDDHIKYECCCDLYSWSLQGSHDNKTWKIIHKVEKDDKFYGCVSRNYDIQSDEFFEHFRLMQEMSWPGCNYCIGINKIELYGVTNDAYNTQIDADENEESVSIIGKVQNRNTIM